MKSKFVTSDWHVGHENSLKFDQRPFRDLDHMHKTLIKNYNSTVPEDGICYFLGDLGMGNKEAMKNIYKQLHGTKVLILGNHDKGVTALEDVFDIIIHGAVVYIGGERVTLSHCPLLGVYREPTDHFQNVKSRGGNWHGEHKNQKYSFEDNGQFHLHGHIHSGPKTPHKTVTQGRQYDIGVVGNNYRPVSFSHIESWIGKLLR
jgi:calcineurin-like phosphoesterase family protein